MMRERQLSILSSASPSAAAESKNWDSADPSSSTSPSSSAAEDFKAQFKSFPSASADAKKQARPVWAMTEKDADLAADQKEQAEEDELLKFAENLDFDKYVSEVEVRTMMDRLRKRIGELEKEVALEDQKEADLEMRQERRALLAMLVGPSPPFFHYGQHE
jgi:hypothetical protein